MDSFDGDDDEDGYYCDRNNIHDQYYFHSSMNSDDFLAETIGYHWC
jgi:hypothetical protein